MQAVVETPLPRGVVTEPSLERIVEVSAHQYCGICGTQRQEEHRYCGICGAYLESQVVLVIGRLKYDLEEKPMTSKYNATHFENAARKVSQCLASLDDTPETKQALMTAIDEMKGVLCTIEIVYEIHRCVYCHNAVATDKFQLMSKEVWYCQECDIEK